jgi:predicted neuraminidase
VKVLALQSGKWAFIVDDENDGRYRLSLYVSNDEGKKWHLGLYLENDKAKKGRFSYPSMIQTPDGLLRITYSYQPKNDKEAIKYVVVNPKRIGD